MIAAGLLVTLALCCYFTWLVTHWHHGTVESRELEREATRNREQLTCMWCGRFMITGTHGQGACVSVRPAPAVQQSQQPIVVHVHQPWPQPAPIARRELAQ